MAYMAEPAGQTRKSIGIVVVAFLSLLIALTYALKKNFWKDVH